MNWNMETLFANFKSVILQSGLDADKQVGSVCKASDYIKSTADATPQSFVGIVTDYVNEMLHASTWDEKLYGSRLFFNEDAGFSIKAI